MRPQDVNQKVINAVYAVLNGIDKTLADAAKDNQQHDDNSETVPLFMAKLAIRLDPLDALALLLVNRLFNLDNKIDPPAALVILQRAVFWLRLIMEDTIGAMTIDDADAMTVMTEAELSQENLDEILDQLKDIDFNKLDNDDKD